MFHGPLAALSPMASYLIETVVTLLAVLALAVLVLYAARRAGVGRQSGPLQLVGRLPLDARRAVYLVKVADKVIVIGASEAGLTRLGEVDDSGLDLEITEGPAFSQVLGDMLKQPRKKNTRVETPRPPKTKASKASAPKASPAQSTPDSEVPGRDSQPPGSQAADDDAGDGDSPTADDREDQLK